LAFIEVRDIFCVSSKPITWFKDFMGVGYRYQDVYMNVFPLFPEKMPAYKLWKKTVDWWPDDRIRLSFVEEGDDYWFILYGGSEHTGDNTGFVKKVPISENYKRFKAGYEKKAMLRFGIYRENTDPKKKEKDGSVKKYDLEILKKAKSIYAVSFLSVANLPQDSVEWKCIQENRQ
jgi:hypothetical protein